MILQNTWLLGGGAYFALYIYIEKKIAIFLAETTGPISIYLCRYVPLATLYQDCSSRHDTSKDMATIGQSLFSQYIYKEIFKTLLVRNHSTDFNITWQECSFGDPLPRLFKQSLFVKNWLLGAGLIFRV